MSELLKNRGNIAPSSKEKAISKSHIKWPNFPDWEGDFSEYINNVPNISGSEKIIQKTLTNSRPNSIFLPESGIDFGHIRSACAIALHMHQPLIPAGGNDLSTAGITRRDRQAENDNPRSQLSALCRMARLSMGTRRRTLHPHSRLPPTRSRLATPFCRHFWPRSHEPCTWIFSLRNGLTKSSRCRLRICENTQRLWLPMGISARTYRRTARKRQD